MNNYFFDLFIKKHGIDTFNYIIDMIKKEVANYNISTSLDSNYFLYVFEIAFFEFCDIPTEKIPLFINKFDDKSFSFDIPFSEIRKTHNHSIEYIKKLFVKLPPQL